MHPAKVFVLSTLALIIIIIGWSTSVRKNYSKLTLELESALDRIHALQEVRGDILQELSVKLTPVLPDTKTSFEELSAMQKELLAAKKYQDRTDISMKMTGAIEKLMRETSDKSKVQLDTETLKLRSELMELERQLLLVLMQYNRTAQNFNRGLYNIPSGFFLIGRHYKPYEFYISPENQKQNKPAKPANPAKQEK